jgi:23S rRNA (cytosine1962-C5)-methyltransferase
VESFSAFANRLRKNFRHFSRWAGREGTTAFRVYDRDLPEYPCSIDWYEGRVHLLEYPRASALRKGTSARKTEDALRAIGDVLGVARERIYVKQHRPKVWGCEQYERTGLPGDWFTVCEQGLKFWVNLGRYLDGGLFLDHRRTRARVRREAAGKRFLNLFSYTGAFTVHAAAGGASQTSSVDLSSKYLDWAARNLRLNGFDPARHERVRADACEWLALAAKEGRQYELILIDPPPFSASKAMRRSFNVQRDHPRLLEAALRLLVPGGTLYFSTSFQGFQPQWSFDPGLAVEELTPGSIPRDFQRKEVHRCWQITRRSDRQRA